MIYVISVIWILQACVCVALTITGFTEELLEGRTRAGKVALKYGVLPFLVTSVLLVAVLEIPY